MSDKEKAELYQFLIAMMFVGIMLASSLGHR